MLEITGNHISKLNDGDLRILVSRLCEAELGQCGLPISAMTAGGDQDAPDGGIDVRVDLAIESTCLDFIPKSITGFQVKCSDMSPAKITREMRPDGKLRQSIRDLATSHGAYVIVSSQSSTADSALLGRRNAMRAAVNDLANGAAIHLDFYDQERLANWVRSNTGVGIWLRERIGEPLAGWRSYGNWAYGDPENSEYLLDDRGRIVSSQSHSHEPMTVEKGVVAMRNILARPGGIIRLVGLSGVGKTRLVQALFDNRVGTEALDSAIVAYTDQSHEPEPTARDMLHRLGTSGLRAIVVVDNCNPATHRVLAQIVHAHSSVLSLISVEYDVADDEPEETHVFRLEPASEKVLVEILQRLAPHVSQTDRYRIAEFSGGNARIALALAKTIQHRESLGSLNDLVLFKRLFHQNQESGEALIRAAEACSLVYSFDGETLEGDKAELPILAQLADLSAKEIYRYVNVLRARDLIQRRGRWRAVLPHAISNKLARQALERIPSDLIVRVFRQVGQERLLKSFSRRLGFLHDCEPARDIAKDWLNDPDWLAKPAHLNELGVTLFHNLAPIAPTLALRTIEAAASEGNGAAFLSLDATNRSRWTSLLRALAYEPELFDRAVFLLARFYAAESENHNCNSTEQTFTELFHLYLSGTRALAEQRLILIRKLLNNDSPKLQACGLKALDSMLEAWHFSSSHDFSFGAHSRDFGWEPRTHEELRAWFRATLNLAREIALSTSPHRRHARTMLAQHLRALWTHAEIPDDVEHLVKDLAADDGWPDGWLAIRMTLRFDIGSMAPELVGRLRHIEADLRPRKLVEKIHAYVLSRSHHYVDIVDSDTEDDSGSSYQRASERVAKIVEELGKNAANQPPILAQVLPDLLRQHGSNQCWPFGRGLALGAIDLIPLWQQFRSVMMDVPETERNVSLLTGYIDAAVSRDPDTANYLLDRAIRDPILGPQFPLIQGSNLVDDVGVERLVTSLSVGLAHPWTYEYLDHTRMATLIPTSTYKKIVLGVASLIDGFSVAVHLMETRLHSLKREKRGIDREILALGRELLSRLDFQEARNDLPYRVNKIAAVCFQGNDAGNTSLTLCINLNNALADYRTGARQYEALAKTLFQLQPIVALDTLFNCSEAGPHHSLRTLFISRNGSPIDSAPPEVLLTWANQYPVDRYPKLAWEVRIFEKDSDNQDIVWSQLALRLLEQAPDRASILEIFSSRFRPTSWSGSLANVFAPYLRLVRKSIVDADPLIAAWATRQEDHLSRQIEEERQRDRRVDESFE